MENPMTDRNYNRNIKSFKKYHIGKPINDYFVKIDQWGSRYGREKTATFGLAFIMRGLSETQAVNAENTFNIGLLSHTVEKLIDWFTSIRVYISNL